MLSNPGRRWVPADFGRRTIHMRGRRIANNNCAVVYLNLANVVRHAKVVALSAHVHANLPSMRSTKN